MHWGPASESHALPSTGVGPQAHVCARGPILLASEPVPASIEALIDRRSAIADSAGTDVAASLRAIAQRLGPALEEYIGGGSLDSVRARIYALQVEDIIAILGDITDQDGVPLIDLAQEQWIASLEQVAAEALRTASAAGLDVTGETFDAEGYVAALESRYANAADLWETVVERPTAMRILQSFDAALFADNWASASSILRDSIESSMGSIETDVRTETASFDRYVAATTARSADPSGEELAWVYAGPVDGLQRQFCREVYDLAWTREQVAQLRNGQAGMPPIFFGGGYNCRHQWVQMSWAAAQRRGIPQATAADVDRVNALY